MSSPPVRGNPAAGRLVIELEQAMHEGRPPRTEVAPVNHWVGVVDGLVTAGRFKLAAYGLGRLIEIWPDLPWAEHLLTMVEALPARRPDDPPFHDRRDEEVQLVRREGADTLLVAFCGARVHRMGMPLSMFQRWINPLKHHVVYLRDYRHLAYQDGVPSIGDSFEATVQALKRMAGQVGARRVLCAGMSAGGYGALSYARALEAERVLAFSPATNLDPEFNTFLTWCEASAVLQARFPERSFDLRPRLLAAGGPPPATIVYGRQCWDDHFHAEHVADLPGVRLWPIDGFSGHQSPSELVRRGELGAVLQTLAAP